MTMIVGHVMTMPMDVIIIAGVIIISVSCRGVVDMMVDLGRSRSSTDQRLRSPEESHHLILNSHLRPRGRLSHGGRRVQFTASHAGHFVHDSLAPTPNRSALITAPSFRFEVSL